MMQDLPVYPMRIWRGTTAPPFIVELPIDGAGSAFHLDIVLATGTRLLLSTSDASLTAAPVVVEGETWTRVTWPRTLAQSQMVPVGPFAGQYELKQTEPSGGVRPWLCGEVIGIGGIVDG